MPYVGWGQRPAAPYDGFFARDALRLPPGYQSLASAYDEVSGISPLLSWAFEDSSGQGGQLPNYASDPYVALAHRPSASWPLATLVELVAAKPRPGGGPRSPSSPPRPLEPRPPAPERDPPARPAPPAPQPPPSLPDQKGRAGRPPTSPSPDPRSLRWEMLLEAARLAREHAWDAYMALGRQYEDAVYNKPDKSFQTYLRPEKVPRPMVPELDGRLRCGRTSGPYSPERNVKNRTAPGRYPADHGPGELDRSSSSYGAIRGREQMCIDELRKDGLASNVINGIWPLNILRPYYMQRARDKFGPDFEHELAEDYRRARLEMRRTQRGQGA